MASQAAPQTSFEARRVPRTERLDPSHHVVPDEVPDALLSRWQGMLDDAEAHRKAAQDQGDVRVLIHKQYADELRTIVMDTSMMSHDLIALAYLFQKALIDDAEAESDLLKASHLVVDVMKTIAARLAATDERAALAYARAKL